MSNKTTTTTNPDEKETTPAIEKVKNDLLKCQYYKDGGKDFDNAWARTVYSLFPSFQYHLRGINLDYISADRIEIINLINSLSCLVYLNNLLIEHSDIGDEGLRALANQKVVLKRLGILSLWGSDFTDEGFKEFIHSFHLMGKMKFLYLTQTPISDKGAIAFAENMTNLKSLEILFLNGTKTGLDGLTAIIKNLNNMNHLEKANLMSNYPHAEIHLCEEIKLVKKSIALRADHTHDEYLFKNRRCTDYDFEEKIYKSDDE